MCGSISYNFYLPNTFNRQGDIHCLFSLTRNLICFTVSFICHWTFNTTKENSAIYFRLGHIGIILYIWATSLTVLILEITDSGKYGYDAIEITLAGLIASICLFVLPLDKTIWVILNGGFGGLSFLIVLTLVLASGSFSPLSASYLALVIMNSIGGWSLPQILIQVCGKRWLSIFLCQGIHLCTWDFTCVHDPCHGASLLH